MTAWGRAARLAATAALMAFSSSASAAVDASTLKGKVLFGYQGWFDCPMNGSGSWIHWSRNGGPAEGSLTVDLYPDLKEFAAKDLCPAGDFRIGGQQAYLFSAKTSAVVDAHFKWMEAYGLDGVFVQRFVGETTWKRQGGDVVLKNIMKAAAATGRVWAIEYDVSGASDAAFADLIKKDWQYLVDSMKVTSQPGYLREGGLPVVSVWGVGFTDNHPPADPNAAAAFIKWFKADAAQKYRAYYMGGTPTWWRLLNQDARTDAGWKAVYQSMDAIQPWAVGRFGDDAGVDNYKKNGLVPDLAQTKADGNFYLPVAFPGFSWKNLNAGPANQIPRRGGRFLWRQAMNAKAAGAQALKIAMFDEVDEGTAMFKIAAKRSDAPDKGFWLALDADGLQLPSDWYLRVAGEITKVFHGVSPMGDSIPIKPGDALAVRRAQAIPFAAGQGRDGVLRFRSGAGSGRVDVYDPAGRRVRSLALRDGIAEWDRRDAAGVPVRAGVYLVRPPEAAARAVSVVLP
jgi:hypothetical protein